MITLIVNEEEKIFTSYPIVIGRQGTSKSHLALPLNDIEEEHLKIVEKEGRFIAENCANDPFATLNGLPFGSRTIREGDALQIGDISILIAAIGKEAPLAPKGIEPEPIPEIIKAPEEPAWSPKPKPVFRKKRNFILITGCLFLLIITAGLYLTQNEENDEQELIAAKGVADVSMALLYAQQQNPSQIENWTSTPFLMKNLAKILPEGKKTYAQLDPHSYFLTCPYFLRIYTTANLSRFLIIAQPKPHFFRWLDPREAIVLDSTLMEMRRVRNIRSLNQLLAHKNSLDFVDQKALAEQLNAGTLIPLHKLESVEFLPPPELSYLYPGAQNFVYNAPRYRRLAESALKALTNTSTRTKQLKALKPLLRLPNLVLYTKEGMPHAMLAENALDQLALKNKPLIATFDLASNQANLLISHKINKKPTKKQPELYTAMTGLAKQRQKSLATISDKIVQLLEQNNKEPIQNFKKELIDLVVAYKRTDHEKQKEIVQKLSSLYKESKSTKKDFIEQVKAAGLGKFIQNR